MLAQQEQNREGPMNASMDGDDAEEDGKSMNMLYLFSFNIDYF